jgi:GNAT superfamily N-acetyltransferase
MPTLWMWVVDVSYMTAVVPYEPEQLPQLFELLASHFPVGDRLLSATYSDWLYAQNPFGKALMVFVSESGRWVGFMAMIPVELANGVRHLKTYYVVNVLVHPKHLGKNLFGRMIDAAKLQVETEGAALMGHPNAVALKAWQRTRMVFHAPLQPWLAKPISWRGGIQSVRIKKAEELAVAADVLSSLGTLSDGMWRVSSSLAYLTWRYWAHPTTAYKLQRLDVQGSPVGIQIVKKVRPGLNLLIDHFVRPEWSHQALACLPGLTVCFKPALAGSGFDGMLWELPLKKRIPFFLTLGQEVIPSAELAQIGFSASDF